jgi:hypothetical protein
MLKKSRLICWLVLGLVVSGVTLVALALPLIRRAEQAERTLQAVILCCDLLNEFARDHPGQWPESWEDLENVQLSGSSVMYRWPADRAVVQNRVEIDFDHSRQYWEECEIDSFVPLKPIGPCYEYDGYILNLFRTVHHGKAR